MKQLILILCIGCLASGCQIVELEQEGMGQDVQLSNTNWAQGRPVYAYKKAWYIIDLGPINDPSLRAILRNKLPRNGDLHSTTITTTFNWFDTLLRAAQSVGVGLPVVGSRTIIVEGQTTY
ncbi:hypothetical protein [Candidatus Uabimicrobium amorphum]|uniref:Uncharacterized protein n=1 Tax=Uabimicrobium amorphum TaxID=2596890 RepID=A0A5S9II38_UABAM|nr:hypothetical protein [Candidatus Uabimicrobium amorphum]BBM82248.1 hypothetical protein UABAM_00591 [Candidatus Uabimicrobium amorphum]